MYSSYPLGTSEISLKVKMLAEIVNKEGLGKVEIRSGIQQIEKVIGYLNSIWWDKPLVLFQIR